MDATLSNRREGSTSQLWGYSLLLKSVAEVRTESVAEVRRESEREEVMGVTTSKNPTLSQKIHSCLK